VLNGPGLGMDMEVWGMDLEMEEQFEVTELCLPDLEADEETEIIEFEPSDVRSSATFRVSFLSFLFRGL